jgi:RNA polymerase sigma factor (sigma-70 family)
MEAASASRLTAGMRARQLEREFARLRPLGEAYLLRRFNGEISRTDAEDAVAEVLIRLHKQISAGNPPRNLQAAFLTSARNAAIDFLRSPRSTPSASLEAVADTPAEGPMPAEWAESRESTDRLQEALRRMRPNYSQAIVLRYGLGMTVAEVARQLQISLPAAKKLVVRATHQVKEQLAAIEGTVFCPEMRELAQRSVLEKDACGLADKREAEILRAHLGHCGSCRSFAMKLHDSLHELGSAGLLGLAAGDRVAPHVGVADQVAHWLGGAAHGIEAGAEKVRHLALRASSALSSGEGPAGVLMGTGQKVAAICGAATAATATCLITGAVGPGLGASPPADAHQQGRPVPHLQSAPLPSAASQPPRPEPEEEAAREAEPASEPSSAPPPSRHEEAAVAPEPAPAEAAPEPPAPPPSEFGIEGGQSSSDPEPPPSESAAPETAGSTGEGFGGGGSARAAPSTGTSGTPGVGFQG